MESWLKVSMLLCIFGGLKEFRPSEPYVTKYLTNSPMNFTLEQISSDIYPVCIYSTMISLVFVLLFTDILRHKLVVVCHILTGDIVYILFIFGRNLLSIQIAEMFYGLFMASEVAYYTYIYAKVDKSHYLKVSGYTKAASLTGRSLGSLAGQVLLLYDVSTYFTLNYITLASTILSTMWTFFLPPVSKTDYINELNKKCLKLHNNWEGCENNINDYAIQNNTFLKSIKCMKNDFLKAFTNFHSAKWVMWYALASCGYYQVMTYIQVLWEDISSSRSGTVSSELNGLVDTVFTLFSAAASYSIGLWKIEWNVFGELILCVSSLFSSLMLFSMSWTNNMLFAYLTFILYGITYHGMSTITNSEIAKAVNEESHGLIFGFSSLLGFIFQSVLLGVVNSYLSLPARIQFIIYGSYFGILGGFFGITVLLMLWKRFGVQE